MERTERKNYHVFGCISDLRENISEIFFDTVGGLREVGESRLRHDGTTLEPRTMLLV